MRNFLFIPLFISLVFLSACESSSERAERHYEAAVAFADDGELTKAVVELRNVLQLVPEHRDARWLYAEILLETGKPERAIGHYVDLTERYPDDAEANLAVARLALELGAWDRVEQYLTPAKEQLPEDNATVRVIQANLDYRDGLAEEIPEQIDTAVSEARQLLDDDPGLMSARRIVIDDLVRKQEWLEALDIIDAGLEQTPDMRELYDLRLPVLNELGRTDEVTAQLREMLVRFPSDIDILRTLVRWYSATGDLETAEELLRKRADDAPDELEPRQELLSFLAQTQGVDRVKAELDQLIDESDPNVLTYKASRAALDFQTGLRNEAINALEDLLNGLSEEESTSEIANDISVDLAQMHAITGNQVRSQTLVDTVLQNDPNHIGALKLLAQRQIDGDRVEDALVTLRSALREAPRDQDLMTLMADAHERAGEPELQREMLSLAVEASGRAPEESMRYAANLVGSGRYLPAEDVLVEALRLAPDNIDLLRMLGQVQIANNDWGRAEQVVRTLSRIGENGNETAAQTANTLRAQLLNRQERDDDLIAYLENLASEGGGLGADIALIRKHIDDGNIDEARSRLDALLSETPDDPALQFVNAAFKATEGKTDEAKAIFEGMLAENPDNKQVILALYRLLRFTGDTEAANALLDQSLQTFPEDAELLLTKAAVLENDGDIDGAIEIYETLYARNSASELVANNLASLLSTYRDDPETLERAYQVARRLRASQIPAFRETYGWIAARLGRYDEALEHLVVAAQAFPETALVQYHFAVALAGAEKNVEALAVFNNLANLDLSALPQEDRNHAAEEIERLTALVAASSDGTAGEAETAPAGDGSAD